MEKALLTLILQLYPYESQSYNADMRLELLSLGDCNRPMHSPEEVKDHHFLASGLDQRFVYRGLGGFTRKHYCTKEL